MPYVDQKLKRIGVKAVLLDIPLLLLPGVSEFDEVV
jgi:hypothetical protein